jgi:hypothetical protein
MATAPVMVMSIFQASVHIVSSEESVSAVYETDFTIFHGRIRTMAGSGL